DRTKTLHERVEVVDPHVRELKSDQGPIPFERMDGVHFARFVVLDEWRGPDGKLRPPSLLFCTQYDGSEQAHLDELIRVATDGLCGVFENCAGFDAEAGPSAIRLSRYLRAHALRRNAFFLAPRGRSVGRILGEEFVYKKLRELVAMRGPDDPEQLFEYASRELRGWKQEAGDGDVEIARKRAVARYMLEVIAMSTLAVATLVGVLLQPPLVFIALLAVFAGGTCLRVLEDQDADALAAKEASSSQSLNSKLDDEHERKL